MEEPRILAAQEYDVPSVADYPEADVWLWQVGNRWVASVDAHETEHWWDGSDPTEVGAPEHWRRPLAETPTDGTLIYRAIVDGELREIETSAFSFGAEVSQ